MLVLTRYQGQTIYIDDGNKVIEITVCRSNQPIRLGINAPKEVNIYRDNFKRRGHGTA